MKTRLTAVSSVVALVTLSFFAFTAKSDIIENWSSSKLFNNSDLVAIIKPNKTEDSKEEVEIDIQGKKVILKTIVTSAKVLHAHKGIAPDSISIMHHRLIIKEGFAASFPKVLAFRTIPITIKVDSSNVVMPPPEYLVYLKKNGDGNYKLTCDYNQERESAFELTHILQ